MLKISALAHHVPKYVCYKCLNTHLQCAKQTKKSNCRNKCINTVFSVLNMQGKQTQAGVCHLMHINSRLLQCSVLN